MHLRNVNLVIQIEFPYRFGTNGQKCGTNQSFMFCASMIQQEREKGHKTMKHMLYILNTKKKNVSLIKGKFRTLDRAYTALLEDQFKGKELQKRENNKEVWY